MLYQRAVLYLAFEGLYDNLKLTICTQDVQTKNIQNSAFGQVFYFARRRNNGQVTKAGGRIQKADEISVYNQTRQKYDRLSDK